MTIARDVRFAAFGCVVAVEGDLFGAVVAKPVLREKARQSVQMRRRAGTDGAMEVSIGSSVCESSAVLEIDGVAEGLLDGEVVVSDAAKRLAKRANAIASAD